MILWDGPSVVNLETNAGLIIQAEAAYYINTRVGNHPNVRGIDIVVLINVSTTVGSPFTIIG